MRKITRSTCGTCINSLSMNSLIGGASLSARDCGRNIRQSTRRTRTIAEGHCRFRCDQEESGKYEGQPENQCLAGSADRRQSALIRRTPYARAHGVEHFKQLVEPLFEQLFPASHQSSSKSP